MTAGVNPTRDSRPDCDGIERTQPVGPVGVLQGGLAKNALEDLLLFVEEVLGAPQGLE